MNNSTGFSNIQYQKIYDSNMQYHYWNLYRNRFIYKTIKKFNINDILDIGCGRGIVTNYLHKKNIQIQGVEIGDNTKIEGSNVFIKYNTNAFDMDSQLSIEAISLFDVIEHIEYPIEFLNGLIAHFVNVKYIIITIPAEVELWTNFDVFYGHFKRYNFKSIDMDFKKCSANIIYKKKFFIALYFFILIYKKIFYKRKTDYSSIKNISWALKIIHKILSFLFEITDLLFRNLFKGSSIILILKVNH